MMSLMLLILSLLVLSLIIIGSVFWIAMLVDCLKKSFKESNEKLIWVIIIVFLNIIGAILYWSVIKKKSDKI